MEEVGFDVRKRRSRAAQSVVDDDGDRVRPRALGRGVLELLIAAGTAVGRTISIRRSRLPNE